MRALLATISLASPAVLLAAAISSVDVTNRKITEIDPGALSPSVRESYVEILKQEAPWKRDYLIRLKDEATMSEIASAWEKSEGTSRTLRMQLDCASPWMVPKLADFLYRDEPRGFRRNPDPEVEADLGFSHITAVVLRRIIIRAPEIPEAAKAWCRSFAHDNYPEMVTQMRRWWEANRDNLIQGHYGRLINGASEAATQKTVTLPAAKPPGAPLATTTREASPTPTTSPALPSGGSAWWWPIGIVVFVVAAAALIKWRQ